MCSSDLPKPRAAQGTEEAINENTGAAELCYLWLIH